MIVWTGQNSQEISAAIAGRDDLKPFELAGGVWLRQRAIDDLQLVVPTAEGEQYLEEGDAVFQSADGAWHVRRLATTA